MSDMDWRAFLYPLGFLASIAFTSRFLLQWLQSESKRESHVRRSFWKISMVGNVLLLIHTFIQVHYPLGLVQGCNFVIAWRNLNLMAPTSKQQPLHRVFALLILVTLAITTGFILQSYFLIGHLDWVRTPTLPWNASSGQPISFEWHLVGTFGIFLFSSRFWVQWWLAERKQSSYLGRSFWTISLVGAILALIYFIQLGDTVNILGTGTGIIPYVRNLALIYRQRAKEVRK